MALTTEQKINLLILAEFEPRILMYEGKHISRIVKTGAGLGQGISDASFTNWGAVTGNINPEIYGLSEWHLMRLDECPDELIYRAIGADHADN